METDEKTRLMLVDDHPLFLEGVRGRLEKSGRVKVIGEALNGGEALEMAKELAPDVVFLDISLPDTDGLRLIGPIQEQNAQVKVTVLTMHSEKGYVLQALRAGACGYLLKSGPSRELVQALEAMRRGETFFSSGLTGRVLAAIAEVPDNDIPQLSTREREVLEWVTNGLPSKEIASRLSIAVRTVEKHRENIMRKMEVHSAAQLTRIALTVPNHPTGK
jgi:two-component system nitrate/nitrite response regulator NarL